MKKWMLGMAVIPLLFLGFSTLCGFVAYPFVWATGLTPFRQTAAVIGVMAGAVITLVFCIKFYDDNDDLLDEPLFKPRKEPAPNDELLRPR